MKLLNLRGDKMVGASGFEPPTSWSRKMQSKNLSASSGDYIRVGERLMRCRRSLAVSAVSSCVPV